MRLTMISVVTAMFFVVGCGSSKKAGPPAVQTTGACASSGVVGNYTGDVEGTSDTMTLNGTCAGTSQVCGAFTYQVTSPATNGNWGSMNLNMSTQSNQIGCPNQGQNSCSFTFSNKVLTLYCGDSTATYNQQ